MSAEPIFDAYANEVLRVLAPQKPNTITAKQFGRACDLMSYVIQEGNADDVQNAHDTLASLWRDLSKSVEKRNV